MISWIRDYTIQTVFVALQATIIIYGILATATLLKGNGYPEYDTFSSLSKFVRHAGIVLFLVPAAWVWLTYWYEQSDRNYPTAFTVATGIAVIVLLSFMFSRSIAGTARKTFIHDMSASCYVPISQPNKTEISSPITPRIG